MIRLRRVARGKFFVLIPLLSAIIFAGCLLMAYFAFSTPIDVVTTNVVAQYSDVGFYNYVATLKPNFLYGKTILRPGDGVLYSKITTEVALTFTHVLDGSPNPENVSTNTVWDVKLESGSRWSKDFNETDASRLFKLVKGSPSTMTVNVTEVTNYANIIEGEGGFYPSSFNLTITPTITESFIIAGRPVNTLFNPTLTLEFMIGDQNGDIISMSNLAQREANSINDSVVTHSDSVQNQRIIWSVGALLALSILAGSTLLRINSTTRREDELEKILASHRELIVRNSTGPSSGGKINILESFEDLVKTSEILLKPILFNESDEGYVFWIYDGNVRYQFRISRKIDSTL
jgi:hypothetical protein